MAVSVRELGSVLQQVADHLCEACRVAVDEEQLARHRDLQLDALPAEDLSQVFAGAAHHPVELDALALQPDLAPRDARDVQQVVDESGHLLRLPVDHLTCTRRLLSGRRSPLEDVHAVPDRRERVPQLVREHGEEVVLAPVGVDESGIGRAQRLLSLLPLQGRGDLVGNRPHELHFVRGESRARPRPEGQGAEETTLGQQGMAGVGLDAPRLDQRGPAIRGVEDVLGDDPLLVTRDAAANGFTVVEPLHCASLLGWNAGARVQVQPARRVIHQEVEEHLAVEVAHDLAADLVDESLRVFGCQQPPCRMG